MSARPVHFDMSARDPERMAGFYSTVFGWTCHKWDGPNPYWWFQTGPDSEPGINGGIWKQPDDLPPVTVNSMRVTSLDETVATILEAGGTIVIEKFQIPGVGWWAQAQDTEGNLFGVLQPEQPGG